MSTLPLRLRRAWKQARAVRHLQRPRPLYVVVGNCMSVSTGPIHAAHIFRAYLNTGADVLLLSECADVDAVTEVETSAPDVWEVRQLGPIGSPGSALVLAWRRDRGQAIDFDLTLGSPHTPEGGGIRDRFIVGVHLVIDKDTQHEWRPWFHDGHAPPARAPKARRQFMLKFARLRGVRGGDLNLPARLVARFTGNRVRGVHVLCLVTPWWIPVGEVERIPKEQLANADHDGAGLVLWPRP